MRMHKQQGSEKYQVSSSPLNRTTQTQTGDLHTSGFCPKAFTIFINRGKQ